ncbi:L-threonylcarbamoyladenylate synthase [Patescibacteria group bacterium]|nr:L-threonylcarbamoyladenylate synthase [Patescibacteria group bacterium]MCL5797811.1 L-threonylcarbamoyladenylate synthase [Patescibacteria group bacterium]
MEEIKEAIKILRQGGIVIYPTDTAYGIGCRIDLPDSVQKLFKLRKRPLTQATPVLVDSIRMAQDYLFYPISDIVRHIIKDYWPGALTIVLPGKTDLIPPPVRGNGKNIGFRIPDHEIALRLISGVGVPILGPSANLHGQATPYRFEDIDKLLVKKVDYVLFGKCKAGNVSTVIDCSGEKWKILRQGAVRISEKYAKRYTIY